MRWAAVGLLPLLATVVAAGCGSQQSANPKPCTWDVQKTAKDFHAVAGMSPTDAWAVGNSNETRDESDNSTGVIYHWDGHGWSAVDHPTPKERPSNLNSVLALSRDNVWALGYQPGQDPLIEHWDGHSWRISKPLDLGGRTDWANFPTVVKGPNEVWLAGQDVVKHWDGTRWDFLPTPSLGASDYAASPDGDAWVVGATSKGEGEDPAVQRWTGDFWQSVPTAKLTRQFDFDRVAVIRRDDAWLLATSPSSSGNQNLTGLLEHWNGKTWSVTPSAVPNTDVELADIAATGGRQVWVAGDRFDFGDPFVLRWNGKRWHRTDLPAGGEGRLNALAAARSGDVWAVGRGVLAHFTPCQRRPRAANAGA